MPSWANTAKVKEIEHPPLDSRYRGKDSNFSIDKAIAHTVRKAGYKSLGNGQLVLRGKKNWLRCLIEGNSANERYHRMAYESSQRNSAALLAETYRGSAQLPEGQTLDLADSDLVKDRFYRQDNLRFNPQLNNPEYGLSKGNKTAVKLSRYAHWANGATEIGAAPTGMSLKISKLFTMPKRADNSAHSQLRVCFALVAVGALVAIVSKHVIGFGVNKAFKFAGSSFLAVAAGFNAVTAVAAFVSLSFGVASVIASKHSKLSGALMDMLHANKTEHLNRLHSLINEVKDKPNAIHIVSLAMKKKIPAKYCDNNEQPVLLARLLEDVRNAPTKSMATQAMQKTIGAYLTERCEKGDAPNEFLDPKRDSAELLKRENHFLALTNLIEHVKIHDNDHKGFRDWRTNTEHAVENSARPAILNGAAKCLKGIGLSKASNTVKKWRTTEYINQREKNKNNPELASKMRFCADNILRNPHQYGPLTRGLANVSEGLRVISHGVLMSLNYLLTRPIAYATGVITEKLFHIPNSRTTSFSVGRLLASSVWAVMDAFLFLSLAAGNGLGFNVGHKLPTKLKFPIAIPSGFLGLSVAINSTAAQMMLVGIPSTIFMWAAQSAARLEGWKGDIARPVEKESGGRKPLTWA